MTGGKGEESAHTDSLLDTHGSGAKSYLPAFIPGRRLLSTGCRFLCSANNIAASEASHLPPREKRVKLSFFEG